MTQLAQHAPQAPAPVAGRLMKPALQRKPGCSGGKDCECEECRKSGGALQRLSTGRPASPAVPPVVHEALQSPGQPLDAGARTYFEPRFGHDFSQVRIHSDGLAAESARAVGALAYTVGSDIVFDQGRFAPSTETGRHLLGHELTHVVQQRGVRPSLQPLSIAEATGGPLEAEADAVAARVSRGESAPQIRAAADGSLQRSIGEPAGGCGICIGSPQLAGQEAHRIVQLEFEVLHSFGLVEFPFSSPGDENGELDLALPTPTGFAIGEIKPANPKGLEDGIRDLGFYNLALQDTFPNSTIEHLNEPIPPSVMTDPVAAAAGCPPQVLSVILMLPGLYGYFCEPSFAELRSQCRCGKKQEEEEEEEQEQEQEQPEKVKDKEKKQDQEEEQDEGESESHGPPPSLVPVAETAFALALMAAILKFGGKRVTGPLTVIAAIILISRGAKASVGLKGDDALEALFKSSEQNGVKIPDDLKDAIEKDPALKAALTRAAESGNTDAAKQQLGEQLTRVIAENRDQFTDEEIQELLTVTEQTKGVVPNSNITAAELRKALDARHAGAQGQAGSGSAAPEKTPPTEPGQPKEAQPVQVTGPATRLLDALQKAPDKVRLTPEQFEQIKQIVTSVNPPLTDQEVDQLISKIASAQGKSADEVIDAVRQAVTAVRAASQPGGGSAQTPADATDAGAEAQPKTAPPAAPLESVATKTQKPGASLSAEAKKTDAKLEDKFGWVQAGQTFVGGPADLVFQEGVPFNATLISRDPTSHRIVIGHVKVTPKRGGAGWVLVVSGGAPLYDASGQWGTTKASEVPAFAGAGEGKAKTTPAKANP